MIPVPFRQKIRVNSSYDPCLFVIRSVHLFVIRSMSIRNKIRALSSYNVHVSAMLIRDKIKISSWFMKKYQLRRCS